MSAKFIKSLDRYRVAGQGLFGQRLGLAVVDVVEEFSAAVVFKVVVEVGRTAPFSGGGIHPGIQLSIDHYAATYSSAERDADQIAVGFSHAIFVHTNGKTVGVVIDKNRLGKARREEFFQLHVLEGRDVGQTEDDPFTGIHQPGNADADPHKIVVGVGVNERSNGLQDILLTFKSRCGNRANVFEMSFGQNPAFDAGSSDIQS